MPPQDAQLVNANELTRTASDAIPAVNSHAETHDYLPPSGRRAEASTDRLDSTPTPVQFTLPAKYSFVGRLGRGGMGEVIHAFDNELQRHVAIKYMRPVAAASAFARRRFLDEARILAQMHHPNVVDVYEKGEVDGEPYFVMAYLDGYTLAERREEFRTCAGRAVGVMVAVAGGVQHAHENGVFHRDLKGSNVMFDDGRPVVVDFGCARWDDAELSTQGFALLGTASHMAPEVYERGSRAHDARSDLWSLGVMLYHLLGGALPFAFDTRAPDGRDRLLREDPAPLRSHPGCVPGVDDRLEAIVGRALAKNPDERYQTVAAFAAELVWWAETAVEPPPAVPPPAAPKRRSRVWVAVGVGGVAVSLAASLAATFLTRTPAVAEDVQKGQSVVLVDGEGVPRRPCEKVAGFVGGVETDATEKALSITSGGLLLVRFPTDGLTPPYRVRADFHHSSENSGSEIGLVVAHRLHSATEHAIYANTFRAAAVPAGRARETDATAFGGPRWVVSSDPGAPLNDLADETSKLTIHPHAWREANDPAEFRRVSVTVTQTDVSAAHAGRPFPLRQWKKVGQLAQLKFDTEERPAPNPLFGGGVGLLVRNGSGLVRNVVIEPLPTP